MTPDGTTLWVNCLPCKSSIQHTASVIATFLRLEGRDPNIVEIDELDDDSLLKIFRESSLANIEQTDLVIIGQVHQLAGLQPGRWWEEADNSQDELFRWHTFLSAKGKKITLLGCREGLWGESTATVAQVLREKAAASCIIYIGKVGALRAKYTPNEWIATGKEATVAEQVISWDGLFQDTSKAWASVAAGTQFTVASPLCETTSWFHEHMGRYDWVDCETGHLAKAAKELGMQFGYLHLVSDNLEGAYDEDLSNEDGSVLILKKRDALYRDIESIIKEFLASWDHTQNT